MGLLRKIILGPSRETIAILCFPMALGCFYFTWLNSHMVASQVPAGIAIGIHCRRDRAACERKEIEEGEGSMNNSRIVTAVFYAIGAWCFLFGFFQVPVSVGIGVILTGMLCVAVGTVIVIRGWGNRRRVKVA